jgi:hypothetical protein
LHLEELFWKHNGQRLAALDLFVWQYAIAQVWGNYLSGSFDHVPSSFQGYVFFLLTAFHVQGLLIIAWKSLYTRKRCAIVSISGVCKAIGFSFAARSLGRATDVLSIASLTTQPTGASHLTRFSLLFTGPLQLLVCALGGVQTFASYLLAQTACTIATCLLCTGHAVSMLSTGPHREFALHMYSLLNSTFTLTSGSSQPVTELPCQLHTAQLHTLVLFLQLYLGLLLPSYVMYCWELNAKMHMLLSASKFQDEQKAAALRAKLSSPAALLVAERSWRAAATHVLLHLVLIMPLCWSAAALAPHIWLLGAGGYDVATVTVC